MNLYSWLDEYLLSLPGIQKGYKPEWDWMRYMVGGKMFAATCTPDLKHAAYGGRELLTLKCDPAEAELLRREHPGVIVPGFYMDKLHWNSVFLDSPLPDELMRNMCRRSHSLVFAGLTKKLRGEIMSQETGSANNMISMG